MRKNVQSYGHADPCRQRTDDLMTLTWFLDLKVNACWTCMSADLCR